MSLDTAKCPEGPRRPWWGTSGMAPSNSTESFSDECVRIPGWMDFVFLARSDWEIKGTGRPREKPRRQVVPNLDVDFPHLFSLLLGSENVLGGLREPGRG